MVKKIWHIILGNFRNIFKIRPAYFNERYKICKKCSHKKYLRGFGEYCDLCGCIIKSKVSIQDEQCYDNKW